MKGTELSPDVSRRSFLKGGACFSLGATAFATAVGTMGGCTPKEKIDEPGNAGPSKDESKAFGYSYEIYDADVIVVGAGIGGMQAALEAHAKGANILIVEKGPFQFGGVGGMNFDIMLRTTEKTEEHRADIGGSTQLANQELRKAAWPYTVWDLPDYFVRNGVETLRRNPDGMVFDRIPTPDYSMAATDFGFMRVFGDVARDRGILVYDQTMVTDLIVQDGVCKGVVGIHIPTGVFRIFRAKAVIKSTGGCTQFNGWVSVAACTTQGGDNTADVDIAAYRHGCTLIGCEFFRWDTISCKPDGLAFGFNSGFTADTVNSNDLENVDGVHFMEGVTDRTVFFQTAAKEFAAGKTNENGAFYCSMTPEAVAAMRPVYKRNIQLWREKFGIEVEGNKIEIALNSYEHGGSPRIDKNMMSLTLPGLFDVRGGDAYGETAGLTAVSAPRFGIYAAVCAVNYAKSTNDSPANLDWTTIVAELERLNEIRTREVADGIRPTVIRHNIQTVTRKGISPAGTAEQYETCIAELERIIAEDLPRQVVPNKTMLFNTDWKSAIENYNIATIALGTVKAMLLREETRGQFMRSDFPEPNEEFWGKNNVAIRLEGNTMVAEPIPVD